MEGDADVDGSVEVTGDVENTEVVSKLGEGCR